MGIAVNGECMAMARALAEDLGDGWELEAAGTARGNELRKDGVTITVRLTCSPSARQWVLEGRVAVAHPVHGTFWLTGQEQQAGMRVSHEIRAGAGQPVSVIAARARSRLLPPLEAAHAACQEWAQAQDRLGEARAGQLSALLQAGAGAGAWLTDGTPLRPQGAERPDRVRIEGIAGPGGLAMGEFQHTGHTGGGTYAITLACIPAALAARVMAVLADWKQGGGPGPGEPGPGGSDEVSAGES